MARIIFDRAAGLVGEFAEVHLESVRRSPQHVNIRAGAKDARLQTADDDRTHFRMFETNSLDGVSQLDVHSEIVRVEFEFVTFSQRFVLPDIHREPGDCAI